MNDINRFIKVILYSDSAFNPSGLVIFLKTILSTLTILNLPSKEEGSYQRISVIGVFFSVLVCDEFTLFALGLMSASLSLLSQSLRCCFYQPSSGGLFQTEPFI